MNLRRIMVLGAALVTLGLTVGVAVAQTADQKAMIDTAKAQGVVGEQADGFVGFRTASADADLRAAVAATNDGRRQLYVRSAGEAGTTAEVAGARMFETQLLPRIRSGQWYKDAGGRWIQR